MLKLEHIVSKVECIKSHLIRLLWPTSNFTFHPTERTQQWHLFTVFIVFIAGGRPQITMSDAEGYVHIATCVDSCGCCHVLWLSDLLDWFEDIFGRCLSLMAILRNAPKWVLFALKAGCQLGAPMDGTEPSAVHADGTTQLPPPNDLHLTG